MAISEGAGKIVVGVDGSEHSHRALAWALNEARVHGVACVLIHAWNYGLAGASLVTGDAMHVLADAAETLLDKDLTFARASGVAVEGVLVFGPASPALIDASSEALLLVVGSRGRGGLASALLGSVSSSCVHHARCPVVVMPPASHTGPGGAAEHEKAAAR